MGAFDKSHPVRGAWIEIMVMFWTFLRPMPSHPVRGAWIEITKSFTEHGLIIGSHPVRGAWIEIRMMMTTCLAPIVAPRKGCVD